ncbi:hypothetical protein [Mesorhizobium sp. L48C026A00]|uniref:hypothetical protein n=1 Tax=Mesorhizobium sp. L48C026A00 TaxID=1287182 RepID=UPI0003CFDE2C|nr:hypothetical protein [Mesorhizobium sp. L48C026A00]ESZ15254.1 hypothetical protein X737_22240 [Mesorhizobium sp. L48C026A00]
MRQPALPKRHQLVMVLDPGDFHVDRGELGAAATTRSRPSWNALAEREAILPEADGCFCSEPPV